MLLDSRYRLFLLVVLFCIPFLIEAQVSFLKGGIEQFNPYAVGGVATAVADIDGDTHEDLIYAQDGGLFVYLYRGEKVPFQFKLLSTTYIQEAFATLIGDVNNDGYQDIVISSLGGTYCILSTGYLEYTTTEIYDYQWLPQGSNLADIDGDNDLDILVLNDNGYNVILLNDGLGNFTYEDFIDFNTVPESDNSGNYSSIWTDIENDGDLDLYIAKCRAGATELTDPRRINALYIRNDDGTYTEKAAELGLADGLQSWSTDAGDIDNDGDQDIVVTNHDGPHKLYLNEGGTFIDYPMLDFDYTSFAFQSTFADMDNNGWLDIIFADGSENLIIYNDNMNFTVQSYHDYGEKAVSCNVGDFNNDGFKDIWAQYKSFLAGATITEKDDILLNLGNDNNYITFTVRDNTIGNIAGVKVVLESASFTQTREIALGRSYGQTSNTNAHFGLGTDEDINSLTVTWADGVQESYDVEDLLINEKYLLVRGGCLTAQAQISVENDGYLCSDQPLTISAVDSLAIWSDGETQGPTLMIDTIGDYTYSYTDSQGCLVVADYVNILDDSRLYENFELNKGISNVRVCDNTSFTLIAQEAESYAWSTGEDTRVIEVFDDGDYAVTVTSNCGNEYVSDTVSLTNFIVDDLQVEDTFVYQGDPLVYSVPGDIVKWYDNPDAINPIYTGNTFNTDVLFSDTTYYVQRDSIKYFETDKLGIEEIPEVDKYSAPTLSGGLLLKVWKPVLLKSFLTETDLAGERTIEFVSYDDTISKKVYIPEGVSRIDLDVPLINGYYEMRTNSEDNIFNLGQLGPQLARVQGDDVEYQYSLDGISIRSSTNGASRYFYFFDIEVDYDYALCTSDRESIDVSVRTVSTDDEKSQGVVIFPNPTHEAVNVESQYDLTSISIFNASGQEVISLSELNERSVIIGEELTVGIYTMIIRGVEGQNINKRFIKTK